MKFKTCQELCKSNEISNSHNAPQAKPYWDYHQSFCPNRDRVTAQENGNSQLKSMRELSSEQNPSHFKLFSARCNSHINTSLPIHYPISFLA